MQNYRKFFFRNFSNFLVKVAGTPPYLLNSRRDIFQEFLPGNELYRKIPEWQRSPSRFREILGERFSFSAPSGGTVNQTKGNLHQGVKLDSKFLHEKFLEYLDQRPRYSRSNETQISRSRIRKSDMRAHAY